MQNAGPNAQRGNGAIEHDVRVPSFHFQPDRLGADYPVRRHVTPQPPLDLKDLIERIGERLGRFPQQPDAQRERRVVDGLTRLHEDVGPVCSKNPMTFQPSALAVTVIRTCTSSDVLDQLAVLHVNDSVEAVEQSPMLGQP